MTSIIENQIIQIIVRRIPDAIAIYLFGSVANGVANDESDVDLAVLGRKSLESDVAYELKTDLAVALKRDVDLVDLSTADSVTTAQVILTGKLIYIGDSKTCGIFETSSLSKYLQLNQERQGILDDIEKRGSIYGR